MKLICKVMLNQKMWELKSKHSVVQSTICDVTTLEVWSQHGKNNWGPNDCYLQGLAFDTLSEHVIQPST